jgi:hypothetical protein
MLRRIVLLAMCGALLLQGASAHAATGPHGRSARAQAALDASLWHGTKRVQVLTSLCARPSKLRRCSPISPRLQRALDGALGAPIIWVDARRVAGPEFLVFAPVVFDRGEAKAEVAWWDPGSHGCVGGYETRFRKDRGAWMWYQQLGWAGCPASAS